MRYIAVDLGSTHTKCALLDTEALTIAEVTAEKTPLPCITEGGKHETDAEGYFRHVRMLVNRALSDAPDAKGVLFSSQMHGCVIADADGNPLTGLISWQDAAGMRRKDEEGSYVDALDDALASCRNDPDFVRPARKQALGNLYARLEQGLVLPEGAKYCTPGGYAALRLGSAHACHASQAASCGCATVRGDRWYAPSLVAAGLSGLSFPEIVTGFRTIGEYRVNGKAYALYPDVGDHQIGALGSLMREGDDVQLNIGTGGMAGRIVRGFSRAEGCEARPLLGDLYIQTITGLPGGRHLQVVMDFLRDAARMLTGQDIADDKLWSYAAAVDAKDVSLSVVPDFFGPRGGIIGGIGGGNFSPDSLIGAMYFAVARACASAVAALGGAKRLVYTGGAVTRNAGLRRAIEKACGIPGILPHGGDGAMMGHLRLALCLQGVPLDRSGETLAAAYAM